MSSIRTLPGYLLLCGFWSHMTASTGDEEKDTCLLTMHCPRCIGASVCMPTTIIKAQTNMFDDTTMAVMSNLLSCRSKYWQFCHYSLNSLPTQLRLCNDETNCQCSVVSSLRLQRLLLKMGHVQYPWYKSPNLVDRRIRLYARS